MKESYDVVVLGGGISGVGAAILAQGKGLRVFVSDKGNIPAEYKKQLVTREIDFEENQHTAHLIYKAGRIVKSPGIPPTVPIVLGAKEKSIPVVSEIEFASRYTNATLVAITGSNGKTTTVRLIAHLLSYGERSVKASGNIGDSFAKDVLEHSPDMYVLELSSFQLEDIESFRPDIAVLLNITPDHLNRYQNDIMLYGAAKMRIIENAVEEDLFIYNEDDPLIEALMSERDIKAKTYGVSFPQNVEDKFIIDDEEFLLKNEALAGRHNLFNAKVAAIVALNVGISAEDIRSGLDSFRNESHRLQRLGTWQGLEYINDSKATNVDATYFALEAMNKPVVWIAGGEDKGNDYSQLKDLVHEKVRVLIALGEDNEKIIGSFRYDVDEVWEVRSMEEAVSFAREQGREGEVVLLSPACASFDLFENYIDRGLQFIEKVTQTNKHK